jgi:hypothetical protein
MRKSSVYSELEIEMKMLITIHYLHIIKYLGSFMVVNMYSVKKVIVHKNYQNINVLYS